jgi:molybdopterin synthase catalytic subunit
MSGPQLIRVTADPIDASEAIEFVADPSAGGTCVFVGTVREHSERGRVTGLQYEAWPELAERRLREISDEMADRWGLCKVALLHGMGSLQVGDISVVVACSAAHRAEAFEACRHGIERLKEDAPIWKKESLTSGEAQWVMGS